MTFINNHKIHKCNNVKKKYYNFNGDITLNKTSNNYSDDTYSIIKTNNTFNSADSQYFTKKINNTSITTNSITRHTNNNYEHIVIKKANTHSKHTNNYDTEKIIFQKIT